MKLVRLALADKIKVYDFDVVESKNINNQAYLHKHIGMAKVEAIKDLAEMTDPDNGLKPFNKKVSSVRLADGDISFICLDNFGGRADILESPSQWNNLVITGGISSIGGNVEVIKGKNTCLAMAEEYRELEAEGGPEYDPDDLSACGSPISIHHRVDFAASLMVEAMMKFMDSSESEINKNIMFDVPNMKLIVPKS